MHRKNTVSTKFCRGPPKSGQYRAYTVQIFSFLLLFLISSSSSPSPSHHPPPLPPYPPTAQRIRLHHYGSSRPSAVCLSRRFRLAQLICRELPEDGAEAAGDWRPGVADPRRRLVSGELVVVVVFQCDLFLSTSWRVRQSACRPSFT